ncbi:MAG: MFS transporter [Verrucomicrobiales bacterium]|nr:MFS transporter [Verrucomicrobiales bacterium]
MPPPGTRRGDVLFPPVFWVANLVEVLERFAYYGIYFGFGIYMTQLGYSRDDLGIVQSLFLLFSYAIPLISAPSPDRFGFKKVLIVSSLLFPAVLLLMLTKSFSGIALTMLSIGFAAGIFKPLIAGTIRVTTDSTNKTLGWHLLRHGQHRRRPSAPSWRAASAPSPGTMPSSPPPSPSGSCSSSPSSSTRNPRATSASETLGRSSATSASPLPTSSSRRSSSCSASSSGCRSGRSSTSAPCTWTATWTPPDCTRTSRPSAAPGSPACSPSRIRKA